MQTPPRTHLSLREGNRIQLWHYLLQEVFLIASTFPGLQVLVPCLCPLSRPVPSQIRQLRNVESKMNEGLDNLGSAGAPGPALPASHPVFWQLPWPPCGTRPAPQRSGQLRVPGMGGGVYPGQGVAKRGVGMETGRTLKEESSPPSRVPGSGSWKGSWARQAGGGKVIRECRREHCCGPGRGCLGQGQGRREHGQLRPPVPRARTGTLGLPSPGKRSPCSKCTPKLGPLLHQKAAWPAG